MAAGDKQKAHLEWVMVVHHIKYEKEYLGLKPRMFRFDYAIPEYRIAIEFEGGMGQFTSGKSRHTTKEGYTKDTQKYNLAVINGWSVLRYTAKNISDFEADLLALLTIKEIKKGTL